MKPLKIFNNQFILKKQITSNEFGVVFLGLDSKCRKEVVLKIQKQDNNQNSILIKELQGIEGIPKLIWSGIEGHYNIIVLELLGKNLTQLLKSHSTFSLKTVLMVAEKLIILLEKIHSIQIIHSDIRPENILISRIANEKKIYLLDFGIAKVQQQEKIVQTQSQFIDEKKGSPMYASISAHNGNELSCVDDLISLTYVLVYMFKGKLPWYEEEQSEMSKSKQSNKVRMKTELKSIEIFKDMPMQFIKFYDYLYQHDCNDILNYNYLLTLIREAAESNQIVLDYYYDWIQVEENQEEKNQVLKIRLKEPKPRVILSQFDESKFQKLDQWNDLDILLEPINKKSLTPLIGIQKIDFLKVPIPVQMKRRKDRQYSVKPMPSSQSQSSIRGRNSTYFAHQLLRNKSNYQPIKSDDEFDDDSVFIEDSICFKYDLLKQNEVKAQLKSNLDRTFGYF